MMWILAAKMGLSNSPLYDCRTAAQIIKHIIIEYPICAFEGSKYRKSTAPNIRSHSMDKELRHTALNHTYSIQSSLISQHIL